MRKKDVQRTISNKEGIKELQERCKQRSPQKGARSNSFWEGFEEEVGFELRLRQ